MRVVYVAKHGSGFNDDEGAISHALEALGHEVVRVPEEAVRHWSPVPADLLLFHKCADFDPLSRLPCPKVFWYFDLVDWPSDPTLRRRCRARAEWMERVIPLVDLGFCTDGDWAAQDRTGKVAWLPQGADERVTGRGKYRGKMREVPWRILFFGCGRGGGLERESFVRELASRYGRLFCHVPSGVYGRDLANLIAAAEVVVAPDSPVTDRYWSNRVYTALGFGAFLLHPHCEGLLPHYGHDREIVYYTDRGNLFSKIDYALENAPYCRAVGDAGLARTVSGHTYRHRVVELLRTVRERLGVG